MTAPDKPDIKKGLRGVYFAKSKVSEIIGNSLTYAGYDIEDLAENCQFEEVAYLLWNGELPNENQLKDFTANERSMRKIDQGLIDSLKNWPTNAHPMSILRTAVSTLGLHDSNEADISKEGIEEKSFNLLAKIPTIIAAMIRVREGKEPIAPDGKLGFSENFFHMCDKDMDPTLIKAFDQTMILYAEHTTNASTFSAHVTSATQTDLYSAVTAAIGTLKGPLHGGANEEAMKMITEIGSPDKVEDWIKDALTNKRKIMGFGHAEYKNGDSRVPTMKKAFNRVAKVKNGQDLIAIADKLEEAMREKPSKPIYPNVDFPAGPMYHLMDFDTDMFTPFFVMARITGWTAHVKEELIDNKTLIRPRAVYNGPNERKVPGLAKR